VPAIYGTAEPLPFVGRFIPWAPGVTETFLRDQTGQFVKSNLDRSDFEKNLQHNRHSEWKGWQLQDLRAFTEMTPGRKIAKPENLFQVMLPVHQMKFLRTTCL
jgi:hypothetical protein